MRENDEKVNSAFRCTAIFLCFQHLNVLVARTFRAAVHHSSPISIKCNILASTFIPHPLLSQQAFSRFALDYLIFGNAYLEKRTSRLGKC